MISRLRTRLAIVFGATLFLAGFGLVVAQQPASTSQLPGSPSAPSDDDNVDEIKVYQLKNYDAAEVVESLKRIYPALGSLSTDTRTNSVIVVSTPKAIKQIDAFVNFLDSGNKTKSETPEFLRAFVLGQDPILLAESTAKADGTFALPSIVTMSHDGGLIYQESSQAAKQQVTLSDLSQQVLTRHRFVLQLESDAEPGQVAQLLSILRKGDKGSAVVIVRGFEDEQTGRVGEPPKPGQADALSKPTHGIVTIHDGGKIEWRPSSLLEPSLARQVQTTTIDQLSDLIPGGVAVRVEADSNLPITELTKVLTILRAKDAAITFGVLTPRPGAGPKPETTGGQSLQQLYQHAVNDVGEWSLEEVSRKASAGDISDDERQRLKKTVTKAFEARQQLLRQELAEYRSRLDRLARTLEAREAQKEKIIRNRVDELTNPNLRWEVGTPSSQPELEGSSDRYGTSQGSVPINNNGASRWAADPPQMEPGRGGSRAYVPASDDWSNRKGGMGRNSPRQSASTPIGQSAGMEARVYSLREADAEALVKLLQPFISNQTFKVQITADTTSNSLVIVGQHDDIEPLLPVIRALEKPYPARGIGSSEKMNSPTSFGNVMQKLMTTGPGGSDGSNLKLKRLTVNGECRDSEGQPLKDVSIAIFRSSFKGESPMPHVEVYATLITRKNGEFSIDGLPEIWQTDARSSYVLQFTMTGRTPAALVIDRETDLTKPLVITLNSPNGDNSKRVGF